MQPFQGRWDGVGRYPGLLRGLGNPGLSDAIPLGLLCDLKSFMNTVDAKVDDEKD